MCVLQIVLCYSWKKNFVHLGFGNWKMGTDIPSHSPVAGSEEGDWERDEPGS